MLPFSGPGSMLSKSHSLVPDYIVFANFIRHPPLPARVSKTFLRPHLGLRSLSLVVAFDVVRFTLRKVSTFLVGSSLALLLEDRFSSSPVELPPPGFLS